jgi:hypothetical protein
MWIRLEWAADLAHPSSWMSRFYPVSSNFAADDKVKVVVEESDLMSSGGITPMEKLIFKVSTVSLKSLVILLEVFSTEAGGYSLRKVSVNTLSLSELNWRVPL